jgi:hypothetical protein
MSTFGPLDFDENEVGADRWGCQLMAWSFRILRWWPYKLAFVALVVLPFLPAIADRCLGDGPLCLTAHSVRQFIAAALPAGRCFICIAVAVGWLVVCYLALSLGWRRRITSRLLLAFVVTLIFAFLPFFMPFRKFGITNEPGLIFLIQMWQAIIGFPIGYTAFLFYVVLSGVGIES